MHSERQQFPEKIYVSNLPFFLQGWNGCYKKTDETSGGAPVYRLKPYTLYHIFPIIGVKIFRDHTDGIWYFQRDCDSTFMFSSEWKSVFPYGEWGNMMYVTSYDRTWFTHKTFYFITCCMIGSLGGASLALIIDYFFRGRTSFTLC